MAPDQGSRQESDSVLAAGTSAPPFTLKSIPGKSYSLSDFRGKPVVLVFYPADWSPVCGDQIALYNEMLEEFAEFQAQVEIFRELLRGGKLLNSPPFRRGSDNQPAVLRHESSVGAARLTIEADAVRDGGPGRGVRIDQLELPFANRCQPGSRWDLRGARQARHSLRRPCIAAAATDHRRTRTEKRRRDFSVLIGGEPRWSKRSA